MCKISKIKAIVSWFKTIGKCNQPINTFIKIDSEIWLKTVQYQMQKSLKDCDMEELEYQIQYLNETIIDTNKYLVHHTLLELNCFGVYQNYNLIIYNMKNFQNGNLQNIMDVNRNYQPKYIQLA